MKTTQRPHQKFVVHHKGNASSSGLSGCKFLSVCEHDAGMTPEHTCDWSSQNQFSARLPDGKSGKGFKFFFPNCSICGKRIDTSSSSSSCQALFENPRLKFL